MFKLIRKNDIDSKEYYEIFTSGVSVGYMRIFKGFFECIRELPPMPRLHVFGAWLESQDEFENEQERHNKIEQALMCLMLELPTPMYTITDERS